MDMWGIEATVILVMVAINAVFAGYEIALASISHARVEQLVRRGQRGSKTVQTMKGNMEGSLATVQLGITLVGAIAAATGGAGAEEQLAPYFSTALNLPRAVAEPLAIAAVVLPLTAITIIFGELIPKVFALRNPEWVCLRLSPAMHLFALVAWPAVGFLEWSVSTVMHWFERLWQPKSDSATRDGQSPLQDLQTSVYLARTARLIGPREERIMLGAASLSQRAVRDVMLPAQHISMLDIQASIGEALIEAHREMHTRFPVTERRGDPQGIIGYVNFKDLVAVMRLSPQNPHLRAIVRTVLSFDEDTPLASCLESMIRGHAHIAIVRSPAGAVVGMVSLEDMIEELVGEIEDEYDRLPAHVTASGEGWIAGGGITLDRLAATTGIDLSADLPGMEVRTLNDWVLGHLGRPVAGGETVQRSAAELMVRKVRRQKVLEAFLTQGNDQTSSGSPAEHQPNR